jgi:hypothetical protein
MMSRRRADARQLPSDRMPAARITSGRVTAGDWGLVHRPRGGVCTRRSRDPSMRAGTVYLARLARSLLPSARKAPSSASWNAVM